MSMKHALRVGEISGGWGARGRADNENYVKFPADSKRSAWVSPHSGGGTSSASRPYGRIRTPEFDPEDLQSIIRRTHFRRTLKHPLGTTRRLLQKFTSNPKDTVNLVLRFIKAAN